MSDHENPSKKELSWIQPSQEPEAVEGLPWFVDTAKGRFGLLPGAKYIVGRSHECDLQIPDDTPDSETISRRHVKLEVVGTGLRVTDLRSSNGTMVGWSPLRRDSPSLLVKTMTNIRIGRLSLDVGPLDEATPPLSHTGLPRFHPSLLLPSPAPRTGGSLTQMRVLPLDKVQRMVAEEDARAARAPRPLAPIRLRNPLEAGMTSVTRLNVSGEDE